MNPSKNPSDLNAATIDRDRARDARRRWNPFLMRWLESLRVKKPGDYALLNRQASIAIRSINQKLEEKF
jgi:hypothetical protein